MVLEIAAGVALVYAIYKHVSLSTITADVKAAVAKAESVVSSASASSIVTTLKADLKKYL